MLGINPPTISELVEPSSLLQEKILKFVCQNNQVTYDMLVEKLPGEKTSIITSAHTLKEKGLVRLENFVRSNPKSRVFIYPTDKGASFAILKLGIDYRKCIEIHDKNHVKVLDRHISPGDTQGFVFRSVAEYLLRNNLFNSEGKTLGLSLGARLELSTNIALNLVKNGKVGGKEIDGLLNYLQSSFGEDALRGAKIKLTEIYDELGKVITKLDERIG